MCLIMLMENHKCNGIICEGGTDSTTAKKIAYNAEISTLALTASNVVKENLNNKNLQKKLPAGVGALRQNFTSVKNGITEDFLPVRPSITYELHESNEAQVFIYKTINQGIEVPEPHILDAMFRESAKRYSWQLIMKSSAIICN